MKSEMFEELLGSLREQDRRRPAGPVAALLKIIAYEPQLAVKAIHRRSGFETSS